MAVSCSVMFIDKLELEQALTLWSLCSRGRHINKLVHSIKISGQLCQTKKATRQEKWNTVIFWFIPAYPSLKINYLSHVIVGGICFVTVTFDVLLRWRSCTESKPYKILLFRFYLIIITGECKLVFLGHRLNK